MLKTPHAVIHQLCHLELCEKWKYPSKSITKKTPTFEHTFLAILYNKQAALKLKMTSLLLFGISSCCLENFEYATFKKYVGMNCFLKSHYILRTCMLWASGSWAQCVYGKGKGQEGVLLMDRELAVGVSEKVTSSPRCFLAKGKDSLLFHQRHILKTADRIGMCAFWRGCWGVPYPLLLVCLISFTAFATFKLIYSNYFCLQLTGLWWGNSRMETTESFKIIVSIRSKTWHIVAIPRLFSLTWLLILHYSRKPQILTYALPASTIPLEVARYSILL